VYWGRNMNKFPFDKITKGSFKVSLSGLFSNRINAATAQPIVSNSVRKLYLECVEGSMLVAEQKMDS
jgi:hypothetical protein